MKTIKKWWTSFVTTTKSVKERFTTVIKLRIENQHGPSSTWNKVGFGLSLVGAAVAASLMFSLLPAAVLASISGVIPFTGTLHQVSVFFLFTLPVFSFLFDAVGKVLAFTFAPKYTDTFTPFKKLISYPRDLVTMFNMILSFGAVGFFFTAMILVNTLNKLLWIGEIIVMLPAELVQTRSFDGFTSDMKAWFISWTPEMFLEDSLGSVMARQFRVDQDKRNAEKEAKKTATPTASRPPKRKGYGKMPVVTPAT